MDKDLNLRKKFLKVKEELKDRLLEKNEYLIIRIGHIAFLEAIEKLIEVRKEINQYCDLLDDLEHDGKEIINLYRKLENRVENMGIILNTDIIDDRIGVDYFRSLRNEAYNLMTALSGYITEISYTNELSNELIMKRDFFSNNEYKDRPVKLDRFYKDIYNYLTEDMNVIYQRISQVIGVVPLRISKIKYYEIVRETLNKDLENYSKIKTEIIIKRYKSIFNGSLSIGYGQRFDKYFTEAQKFKLYDYKNCSEEQLHSIYEETTELLIEMHNILNIIKECGLITNRLIILSMTREILDLHDNSLLNEILQKWSLLRKDDDGVKEILDLCRKNKLKAENKIRDTNKQLNSIYETLSNESFDQELSNKLIKTRELIALLNDIYFEKEEMLLEDNKKENDDIYLEEVINNFIQFLDRNIRSMNTQQRKIRMRRLLSIIVPYKRPDDFFEYLTDSIEFNNSNEEISFVLYKIAGIIEEYTKTEK